MLILLRATLKIKCKWQLSLKVWLQDSHFTPLHSVQNTKANRLGLLCLCFGFVEVTASDEDSLILQTLWAPVLTVHYLLFIHRGCACQYHPGMKALIFSPWSLDDVKWRQIFFEGAIISLLYLHCNFPCFLMSVVPRRRLSASHSSQQSDGHLCAKLTKEGPATKERPWGSVSPALYSS